MRTFEVVAGLLVDIFSETARLRPETKDQYWKARYSLGEPCFRLGPDKRLFGLRSDFAYSPRYSLLSHRIVVSVILVAYEFEARSGLPGLLVAQHNPPIDLRFVGQN